MSLSENARMHISAMIEAMREVMPEIVEKVEKQYSNETKVVHVNRDTYDVYIGRPSMWGNPFEIGKDGTRTQVIKKYEQWLLYSPDAAEQRKMLPELKGKTLGCWCHPKACHGDVLVKILNNMSDK